MLRCKKEEIERTLTAIPPWLPTALVVIAILWLTLAPRPLGDDPPELFQGADKIVHALMFGGLAVTVLFDRQRSHGWHRVKPLFIWTTAALSSLFGIIIEYLQALMKLGRGFDPADILADIAGASVFSLLWLLLQHCWEADSRQ